MRNSDGKDEYTISQLAEWLGTQKEAVLIGTDICVRGSVYSIKDAVETKFYGSSPFVSTLKSFLLSDDEGGQIIANCSLPDLQYKDKGVILHTEEEDEVCVSGIYEGNLSISARAFENTSLLERMKLET
ncbi:MAG: hypothetical protein HZB68_03060 [Candidatus Aenigmarchaeota archaeon]|nr:hypothetical protein [Candidatus Aenigmarchaeota archaeon]